MSSSPNELEGREPEREREHGHGHAHAHAHVHAHVHAEGHGHQRASASRRLGVAFALTAAFMVVEAAVGLWSGSHALVADAGHMLGDAAALALALVAQRVAARARTREQTYGYRRAEVLAAFLNGMALAMLSAWIFREAWVRWSHPVRIVAPAMLATAVLGLVVNVAAAWVLAAGSSGHNPNTRAAFFHVLSDALGSVGAMVAGVLVLAFDWTLADTVASVIIGALVLYGGWRLLRDTTRVLMEGSPSALDVAAVERTLRQAPGVRDVHDLHLWSISDGFDVMTAHVVIGPGHDATVVVAGARKRVREDHGLDHVTIQPEAAPPERLLQLRMGPDPSPGDG